MTSAATDGPLAATAPASPLAVACELHMFPLDWTPDTAPPAPPPRAKRRQVKNACTFCQKACKKCDEARPCLRCVRYGVPEHCVDSQRKERKKGAKRGPYRKRDVKDQARRAGSPRAPDPVTKEPPPPPSPPPSLPEAAPAESYSPEYYSYPTLYCPAKPIEQPRTYPHIESPIPVNFGQAGACVGSWGYSYHHPAPQHYPYKVYGYMPGVVPSHMHY
ncbi:hypothetical protein HDZ31DRAFT_73536 [Schizophyllum fasciatum]